MMCELDLGPVDNKRLGDVYDGQELPSQIASLLDNWFTCPSAHQLYRQKDNKQVYLVPVSKTVLETNLAD
jgi:hypothetical protein